MQTWYTIKLSTTPSRVAIADVCHLADTDKYMITRINVPLGYRGKGIGRDLLKKVTDAADKEQRTLVLIVASSGYLSDTQLYDWYRRHGFRKLPWRQAEKLHSDMIRYPRKLP